MKKEQQQVKEFMLKVGHDCPDYPSHEPLKENQELRLSLIQEELYELRDAMNWHDRIEIADAIGDLLYVVLGAAVEYGLDIEPIFQEIHKSNMTKFIDGHKRADGKWIKGPSYTPPNLQPIIMAQQKT